MSPGTQLGPYRVLAPLGAGGMGEVFVALDTKLDRKVAVKVIPPSLVGDPHLAARFEREAKALAALNHPNILSIHDFGRDGDTFYSVTELLQGETLRSRLASGPLDTASALRVVHEIAEGLAAAHAKGVVHRDLKPANVFLTEEGRVKILDFGLARQDPSTLGLDEGLSEATTRDRSTRPGTILGTVGYMSPEQARGQPTDARTDIFSLGVILYEMLTGVRPFAGNSEVDVLAAILREPPTPISRKGLRVPLEVERLAFRCMEKSPNARFQSAKDLASAIENSASYPSKPPSIATRLRSTIRPRLGRTALVATLLVALAAAVSLAVVLEFPSRSRRLPTFEPRQITSRSGVEGEPAISPDGTSVAYASGLGEQADLWVEDLRGGPPFQLTTGGAVRGRPAWLPDGSALLFTVRKGGDTGVWKVSRFGGPASLVVPDAEQPSVSPDGRRVAFVRAGDKAEYRVWVGTLGGDSPPQKLTADGDGVWDHEHPAWSPDGKTICYQDQNNLWLVPSTGGKPLPVTSGEANNRDPAWSPDGKRIYFDSYRSGPWAIWCMGSGGEHMQRVTLGTGSERFPSLSADGRRLVYATTGRWLCTLVSRKDGARRVLPMGYMPLEPVFSPDGRSVAFASDKEGGNNLWLMPLRGGLETGEPTKLTESPGNCANLSFSPDGKWIAYHRVLHGERDVWVVSSGGGPPIRFTEGPGIHIQPEWRRGTREISYLAEGGGGAEVWSAPFVEGRRAGPARQLTLTGGKAGPHCWSTDGRWLFYVVKDADESDCWVMAGDGGSPPRRLTSGAGIEMITWDEARGAVLALGAWGGGSPAVRKLALDGSAEGVDHATASAANCQVMEIEASPDGNLFLIVEQENEGDLWVLEAKKGKF